MAFEKLLEPEPSHLLFGIEAIEIHVVHTRGFTVFVDDCVGRACYFVGGRDTEPLDNPLSERRLPRPQIAD